MPRSLERFVDIQAFDYEVALRELRAGRKRTHWMWYVLPQLRGLGSSAMSREYGLDGRREAVEYFHHPVLGPRLVETVTAVLAHANRTPLAIFGDVDAMKFRSCLTLFATVAPQEPCFAAALAAFYGGEPDPKTLELLRADASSA